MNITPKTSAAQSLEILSPWVSDEHRLTPAEIAGEALTCRILEAINRPEVSPLVLALVAVLAIPPASPLGRGGAS